MVLPTNFDDTEHLQATIRRYLNAQIKEDFADLNDANGNWEPSIGTTRASMRKALTHEDSDSMLVTNSRMMLYYFTFGGAKALQPDIVGSTVIATDSQRRYKPQITLYFSSGGYNPAKKNDLIEGEISFRLMTKTATTITQAEVNNFATKIKNLFATPTKFEWHKGKQLFSYTDWDKGYQFQLLVTNEAEAKRITEQVLDIQGHTPEWKRLAGNINSEPLDAYPNVPGNSTILGKAVKDPVYRPVADVRFRYATLLLNGKGRGITLVDTTYTRRNPIERVA